MDALYSWPYVKLNLVKKEKTNRTTSLKKMFTHSNIWQHNDGSADSHFLKYFAMSKLKRGQMFSKEGRTLMADIYFTFRQSESGIFAKVFRVLRYAWRKGSNIFKGGVVARQTDIYIHIHSHLWERHTYRKEGRKGRLSTNNQTQYVSFETRLIVCDRIGLWVKKMKNLNFLLRVQKRNTTEKCH